jgi:hypothetical protein
MEKAWAAKSRLGKDRRYGPAVTEISYRGLPKRNIAIGPYENTRGIKRIISERHGYPRSPPTMVPKVPVKWTRPVRSPADLQVGPETLSTTLAT